MPIIHFTTIGESYPLGATVYPNGINFSVYSRHCTGVDLLLYDDLDAEAPDQIIQLDPRVNRTYHYWHIFVPHLKPGQAYGYRVHGDLDPSRGLRFDSGKVLLDPYGRSVWVPDDYTRGAACQPGDNTGLAMKSVVPDVESYDWENDSRPMTPWSKTIIYELHVAGFTKHPNSGVAEEKRGTYAGVIEKIPYLQELGITAVELLPIFQFDAQDAPLGHENYWGYSPVSFFAPHLCYSSVKEPQACLDEFRDMVKAFHRAGIEVILDVVYNHTAEGNEQGPTFCFRGFSNPEYYLLEPDKAYYSNYSGTGNTLNGNNPIVRRMITDSLRYWVNEMHVDGFRFDLASVLSRDHKGRPRKSAPVLLDIETDPSLAGVKLIAEAWDAGGLYQVGRFIGDSWKEWNGRFRDDVRGFVRGDTGVIDKIPARLLGSPDIYQHERREPEQSINFVTAHDGFTLNDLVSYNSKRNDANGEDNRDGESHNLSWNCGIEGPSFDEQVEQLRERQIKNFLTITLFAMGTPMFVMGDEVRRTQQGNNNAFCQDNEISWFDWSLVEKNRGLFRFVQQLIRRRLHQVDRSGEERVPLVDVLRECRIAWHGTQLYSQDWSSESRCFAFTVLGKENEHLIHFMANAYWEALEFHLPHEPNGWKRTLDTSLASPEDVILEETAPAVEGSTYWVQPRSIVVLRAHPPDKLPIL